MVGVSTGSVSITWDIEPVTAAKFDESDVVQFLDSELDNVSVLIEDADAAGMGASSAPSGKVLNLGSVNIRASTAAYELGSALIDGSYMHMANRQFLNAYYQYARLTNNYNLKTAFASISAGMGSSVSATSALLSIMADNDTAEPTGYQDSFSEKVSYDDLEGDTEYTFSPANYTDWGTPEPKYSDLIESLAENDTGEDLLDPDFDANDETNYKFVVTGFDDLEESVLEVLQANVAANQITASDYITADRITILDYDLVNATMANYFSQDFFESVRDTIDAQLEADASGIMLISIFGFQIQMKGLVTPVKALPSAVQVDILKGITGTIMNIGKAVVSLPMRIKETLIDKPLAAIKGGITKAVSVGKGILNQIVSAPGNFVKTVKNQAKDFVSFAKPVVTSLVKGGTKLVSKGFNGLMGGIKGIFGSLTVPLVIIGIVGLGLVLAYFYINRRQTEIVP